jgi:hypothetical protein
MYEDQPRVKKFREFARSEKGRKMDFFEPVDDFNIPREQYLPVLESRARKEWTHNARQHQSPH